MPASRCRTRGTFGRLHNFVRLIPLLVGVGSTARAVATTSSGYESVVTAAPDRVQPREDQAAAATVVLPADSPRVKDDLGDLLAEVPGVTVTRSGGIGAFASIALRGSNPDEVRIYIDGVPMNVAAGGSVDLSTLPLGDVERIEVYRGTTPIAFGESALGGVIAITTRTPGARQASLRAGSGSFGARFGDFSAGERWGRLRLYVGAHALRAENGFQFRDDGATTFVPTDGGAQRRRNNGVDQLDGVLRAALDLPGRRELSLGLLGLWRRHGLPGQAQFPTTVSRFETTRGIVYAGYESRTDLGASSRLRAQLFFSALRDELYDPVDRLGGTPAVTHDTVMSAGGTLTAGKTISSWARLGAVAEGRRESFQPVNDLEARPVGVPAERLVGAGGVEVDLRWRRLDLDVIPSARLEVVRDVVTGRDRLFAVQRPASAPIVHLLPVLRLGLIRPLTPWVSLKANGGRYARVPSFTELYGDSGRQLGNPELRPEIGWNADAGVSFRAQGARVTLDARSVLFGARVYDLIDWEYTSAGQARANNVSRTRIFGVEQELRLAIGPRVRLTGQATYTDARDVGDIASRRGRQLPAHPRYHGYLRPELRNLWRGRAFSAGAYLEADVSAGAFSDSNNQNALATRWLVGAGFSVDMPRAGLRLAMSARNLGDSRVIDIPNYPLPGRSLFLSLMWSSDLTRSSDLGSASGQPSAPSEGAARAATNNSNKEPL